MLSFPLKLILGSASPRRKQLLEAAGLPFEVKVKPIEENYPADLPCKEVAAYLAHQKAAAFEGNLSTGELLITADTTVVLDDRLLEKPADASEATAMLEALSDRMHQVITGVCLKTVKKEECFNSVTEVVFSALSPEEIAYYIDHYQPFDKAGGYGIQEWIGLTCIKSIRGSYSNVVGLPVEALYHRLKSFR